MAKTVESDETTRQRIDRWLWHVRVVKTRSLAQTLVVSGRVRRNKQKVGAASEQVRIGDVLTIALERRVLVLRVTGFRSRRGDATAAQEIYEDLTPASPEVDAEPGPVASAGERPTKKQRRDFDRDRRAWYDKEYDC